MKTSTKANLRTAEVIDLWVDLSNHVWNVVDSQLTHRRLHDGFNKLMARCDISDRDRVWLRWVAQEDPTWLSEAEQEAIDKAQQRHQVPTAATVPAPPLKANS